MLHSVRTRRIYQNILGNGGFQSRIRVPTTASTASSSSNCSCTHVLFKQYPSVTKRLSSSSLLKESSSMVCLYRRSENRVWFPRGLLAFTTLHTGYWTWYIFDFVPAIAEAATVSVDATVGYVGWTMSAIMWGFSAMYPHYLIHDISYNTTTHTFAVQTFQLLPSSQMTKTTTYPSLTLDNPQDINRILTTLSGDLTLMRGHLPIQITSNQTTTASPNLLLHLTENAKEEIINNDLLLQSLLSFPSKKLNHMGSTSNNHTQGDGKKMKQKRNNNPNNRIIQRMKRRQNILQRRK